MKLQRIVGRDSEELHLDWLGLYPCRTLPRNAALDWSRDYRRSLCYAVTTDPLMPKRYKEPPSQNIK